MPEPKQVKNRVHLDLCATDVDAEIARLTGLGASVLARHDENTVLVDPEGNEFCLSRLSATTPAGCGVSCQSRTRQNG